ncbi:MAG TPA: epimerase, partial [Planctomycetota bacterium]|nr:epimerase [Planctomycetota bacterium]
MSRSLADDLPERIESVDELEDLLSTPSEPAIEALRTLDGDLLLLGVGGKMGPTLARMAVRANEAAGRSRTIYGVA